MILRDITIDVVEAAITHLHINFRIEEHGEELHEGAPYLLARVTDQETQICVTHHPRSDMPVRSAPALVLGLDDVLVDSEELTTPSNRQEIPDATHEVVHMQSHKICTSDHVIQVGLQEVRHREFPLGRRNRNKEIGKGA